MQHRVGPGHNDQLIDDDGLSIDDGLDVGSLPTTSALFAVGVCQLRYGAGAPLAGYRIGVDRDGTG